ncbi:MAG: hypothetical protein J7501_01545 [Bdellovibrio sp.]|nr:hypothetical protein [Bdellovibrio sp.]
MKRIFFHIFVMILGCQAAEAAELFFTSNGVHLYGEVYSKDQKAIWTGGKDYFGKATGFGEIRYTVVENDKVTVKCRYRGTMERGFFQGEKIEFFDDLNPSQSRTFWLSEGDAVLMQKGVAPNLMAKYFLLKEGSYQGYDRQISEAEFLKLAKEYWGNDLPNFKPSPSKKTNDSKSENLTKVEIEQQKLLPLTTDKNGVIVAIPPLGINGVTVQWGARVDAQKRATGFGELRYYSGTKLETIIMGIMKNGYFSGDRFEVIDPENQNRNATFWLDDVGPRIVQQGIYPNLKPKYWLINIKTYWEIEQETNDVTFINVAADIFKGNWPKQSYFASILKNIANRMDQTAESDGGYSRGGGYSSGSLNNGAANGNDSPSSGSRSSPSNENSGSVKKKSEAKKRYESEKKSESPSSVQKDSPVSARDPNPMRYITSSCIRIKQVGSGITSDRFDIINNCSKPIQVLFCEEDNWNSVKCDYGTNNGVGWGTTKILNPTKSDTVISMFAALTGNIYKVYICDMSRGGTCLIGSIGGILKVTPLKNNK